MSELAPTTSPDATSESLGFGAAIVSVFVSRAVGGALVSLFWAALPLYGGSRVYGGWNRYVIGYSLAACLIGAFVMPVVLRMFRYRISFGAALVALFGGVVAANVLFGFFAGSTAHSPYLALPFVSTFGAVGSIVSLLVSAWIVQVSSRRPMPDQE